MASKWIVGNFTYYFRQQALRAANGDISKITFVQEGIEKFDNINWQVEPSQSWNKMLAERARQLRDTYKYIRIFYSGGCDSHTMLKAFIDNKIWPDEIVCIRMSLNNSMDGLINSEVNVGAKLYLDQIRKIMPGSVKIKIYDIDGKKWYKFLKKSYSSDNVRETDVAEVELRIPQSKWRATIPEAFTESDPSLFADILGYDKVRPARWENGHFLMPNSPPGWYLTVEDQSWTGFEIGDFHHDLTEPFYITPDYPELHCKQAHMAKNYLKAKFGPDVKHGELLDYYMGIFKSPSRDLNDQHRDEFYGANRNLYAQQFTIGKHMDEDGVRTWDRILRQEAAPDDKIIKLYDNFMKEHNDTLFKYHGMYGNGTGDPIYVRHYYMGN